MKYQVRATSLYVYYAVIDSEDFPEVFDDDGGIGNKNWRDVCQDVFPYGIQEEYADWEFTDLDPLSDREYKSLKHREEVRSEEFFRKQKNSIELQYEEFQKEYQERISNGQTS